MSLHTDDNTFWSLVTISKNGNLGEIYNKLEDMCSNDNNRNYCLIDKNEYNSCNSVKKLYHNLYGNKTKFEMANGEFTTLYDYPIIFCNYLKYWLYGKIIFNNFNENKIIEVLKAVENEGMFQLIMGTNYTCNFNIFKLEKIKEIKLFYDYIGSYDTKQKRSSINDKICKSSYRTTLNTIIGLYNDRYRKEEKESNEYSNEFDECKKAYNIDYLCKLQCVNDRSLSLDKQQEGCSEVYSSPKHSSSPDTSIAELSQDSTHVRDENNSLGITMTIIPAIAILFVIFPILYKLTPIGPWLHTSVMKTKNSLFNPNENSTDTLSNHISESDSENFMERPHYIAYHSS
ncbi:PIR protein [Plasmodium ovale]|uniref:PIR protein n=1 Tax=Plasmodium ovale TaxID=36330 RepID=A0A1D3KWL3_PLAOA|nr:PIR protein [Plasmodium ovale]